MRITEMQGVTLGQQLRRVELGPTRCRSCTGGLLGIENTLYARDDLREIAGKRKEDIHPLHELQEVGDSVVRSDLVDPNR